MAMQGVQTNTLYVGGLAEEVNEAILRAAFIPFGDIKDVKTPLDQATQRHRSFGFVTFLEREDAAAAMDKMDGAELYGRVLTVNYALPEGIKGGERGCSAQPIWTDADTRLEQQQQEEEMRCIEAENQPAMQAAEDLHRKKLAQEREGEKEEETEIKDDPMAEAEAEVLKQNRDLDDSCNPSTEYIDLDINWKPKVGMEFDNGEQAWNFWVNYGAKIGFGVRKRWSNKRNKDGIVTSYRFVCCKEGRRAKDKRDHLYKNPRQETRTNCPARMGIVYIDKTGKYQVHDFVDEHNHSLHFLETTHMLACQSKVSPVKAYEIDLANDSGIKPKAPFELISRRVGGGSNLSYTKLDQKHYLQIKRQRNLAYGEAGSLLQYFQQQSLKNPSFYYAVQLDMEEKITNIFWADVKMIIDYANFGDVVTFDTTYSSNNAYRPLALFAGLNHYRGVVIFGAALLYDKTTETFKWLFETFLETHQQKKPQTVFTDQDHAIAKALHEVMSETNHGLCTWHLMQNGIKHLGNMMKGESNFLRDFKACIYSYEEEAKFETAWSALLQGYNISENTWLKAIYEVKEKWARCYMKRAFSIGMQSSQLSESLNSDFKSCLKPDLDIIQFFKHFERVVCDKRYNELQYEFKSRQKLPRLKCENSPLLQQVSQLYTPQIFDLFQKEYDLYTAACIKYRNESQSIFEYLVTMVEREGEHKVLFNPCDNTISCSCRKFETFGLLCCHALKVFDIKDIKSIPIQYILKRWTKDARSGIMQDARGREVLEDANLDSSQRYRQLGFKLIQLAAQVADCKEAYSFVDKAVEELSKQAVDICKRQTIAYRDGGSFLGCWPNLNECMDQQNSIEMLSQNLKGLKQPKKRQKAGTRNTLQNQQLKENEFLKCDHSECQIASVISFNNLRGPRNNWESI